MIAKDLQQKALHLNTLDKVHLVEIILKSLNNPDLNIEKQWVSESEKRYLAYKNGCIERIK